jgi:hypothetical protein
MILGQIMMDSLVGKYLYAFCKNNTNIKTVVEIGTWHGLGSTDCIIRGLRDSGKANIHFMSIESNRKMLDVAMNVWNGKLPSWASLVHGHIVEPEEMDAVNLGYQHPDEAKWFQEDKEAILSSPNVLTDIPSSIDLLFLDGGEFSTAAEFSKLKDRAEIIVLDDTITRKCLKIRDHVLSNPDTYEVLFDFLDERNGTMGFKRRSN